MTRVLESQLPVLIVLLVLSSGAKLVAARSGGEPGSLTRLGPAALVPERWQAGALVTCAAGELALAGGLLLSTHALFRWWTVVFFALSTYVLLELRRRRPDAGCGCFGEVSGAPVGLRSVGRTLVLTGMALLSVWAPVPGWAAYGSPAWAIAAGVIVLAVLSPEIEETVERIRYRAPCEQRPAPEEGSPSPGSGRAAPGAGTVTNWRWPSRTTVGGSCAGASSPSRTTTATTSFSPFTWQDAAPPSAWHWSARNRCRNIRLYSSDAIQPYKALDGHVDVAL